MKITSTCIMQSIKNLEASIAFYIDDIFKSYKYRMTQKTC